MSILQRAAAAALVACVVLPRPAQAVTKAYEAQARCFMDPPRAYPSQIEACGELIATPGQSKVRYAQAYSFRGLARYASGDRAGALDDVNKATELDPTYFVPYSLRGRVYADRRDFDRAIAEYDVALRMEPRYAFGHWWRGQAYAAKGEDDRALADYDAAIERLPGVQIYLDRGIVRLRHGDAKLADDDFARAAEISRDAKMLSRLGATYAELGLYDRAMLTFARALDADPSRANTWNERCWARAVAGRELAAAQSDCDHALGLNANDPDYLDTRGLLRFRTGDYIGAIADFDASLARNGKSAGTLFVRGLTKAKLGRATEGQDDIKAALALDPKVAETYAKWGVRPD